MNLQQVNYNNVRFRPFSHEKPVYAGIPDTIYDMIVRVIKTLACNYNIAKVI